MRLKEAIFMLPIGMKADRNDWHGASKWAKRWAKSEPSDFEAWYTLGVSAGEDGAIEEQIAAYERCIALNPEHGDALVNLGAIYCEQCRYGEGERVLRRAREVNSNDPLAYKNLALCLAHQNKREDTIKVLEDLVHLGKLSAFGYKDPMIGLKVHSILEELSPELGAAYTENLQSFFRALQ